MDGIKIVKARCINDKVQYIEEGNLEDYITYPKGYNGKVEITLSNNESNLIPLEVLQAIPDNSESNCKKYPILEYLKKNTDPKELDYAFPEITYKDITDFEFNGFEKIEESTLVSQGLWINNGIRRIELYLEGIELFLNCARKKQEDEKRKIQAGIRLLKKNNDNLPNPIYFDIKRTGEKVEGTQAKFVIEFDTDKLGKYVKDSVHHTFYGEIHIQIRKDEAGGRDSKTTYSFIFPFEIKMINPALSETHIKNDQVSIDFGTSSTCIASNRGKDLLSFNDNPKDLLDYENMTALIIYNWEAIYKTWRNDNETIPSFNRNKMHADNITKNDHFDYGDKIKWELENAPDAQTMDAIINNLKALPGKLQKDTTKEEIVPFDNWKNKVYLTDKLGIDEENDETLNPIALYGYLIGRSLNLQIRNKIYTKYNLTMPVNFSQYKREKILKSLEYGIKRSLPSVLKNELVVGNNFEESVALLGVAKKLKYLKLQEGKSASLFAVFDFGGGTLDFAFGLYRKPSEDENISILDDEFNKYTNVIEIFKTDGELVGGETLIQSLSLKLYKDNREIMEQGKFPVFIPEGEFPLDGYPANLMGNRHIDHVNLKSLDETFSRHFFINNNFSKTNVELFSIEDSELLKDVELTKMVEEDADDFLNEKISKMVKNFKSVLEKTFEDNTERIQQFGFDSFDIDDIKILQAGNASKAKWVEKAFSEFFQGHENIIFVNNEKKNITPKNAVAKGGLMLDGFGIYNHGKGLGNNMPLDRYIWSMEGFEEEEGPVFVNGDTPILGWRSISKITNGQFTIFYSSVKEIEDEDDEHLLHHDISIPENLLEDGKYDVYVKPYDGNEIDCVLGNKAGDNIDASKVMIIDLNTGEIIR